MSSLMVQTVRARGCWVNQRTRVWIRVRLAATWPLAHQPTWIRVPYRTNKSLMIRSPMKKTRTSKSNSVTTQTRTPSSTNSKTKTTKRSSQDQARRLRSTKTIQTTAVKSRRSWRDSLRRRKLTSSWSSLKSQLTTWIARVISQKFLTRTGSMSQGWKSFTSTSKTRRHYATTPSTSGMNRWKMTKTVSSSIRIRSSHWWMSESWSST